MRMAVTVLVWSCGALGSSLLGLLVVAGIARFMGALNLPGDAMFFATLVAVALLLVALLLLILGLIGMFTRAPDDAQRGFFVRSSVASGAFVIVSAVVIVLNSLVFGGGMIAR